MRVVVLVLCAELLLLPYAAAATKACVDTLSQCKVTGCAKPKSAHGLANSLKHNRKPAGPLLVLSFADFQQLQDAADARLDQLGLITDKGSYRQLSGPDRARLREFKIDAGSTGEGKLVQLTGYISQSPGDSSIPHPNTGESVNCYLTDEEENDFHINITPRPQGSEYQGLVVEMIPQKRPSGWDIPELKQVRQEKRQVRVRGQLFFDSQHGVNTGTKFLKDTDPKRFTVWEIHPVTSFDVCTKAKCDPETEAGWKPLQSPD